VSSDRDIFRNLVLNAAMGSALGAGFALLLLALNVHDISDMLQHNTSPVTVCVILVAGTSMHFAFGAALTGFHFAIMDESRHGS
jgi:hypothetical protein